MRRKYPWEDWFSKRVAVLVRGVDYHCSQSTMAQTVRNNASAKGLRVRLHDTGTKIVVEVLGKRKVKVGNTHTDTTPVPG